MIFEIILPRCGATCLQSWEAEAEVGYKVARPCLKKIIPKMEILL
jgi:hypothetical protein